MIRIEAFKKWIAEGKWKHWEEFVAYPNDVEILKANIPELDGLTDLQIDDLYSDFSTVAYCAGWMSLRDKGRDFREWLLSYPNQPGTKFDDYGQADWYAYYQYS